MIPEDCTAAMPPELEWTGERLVPSHTGDTAIEHLHRYAFARELARGKDVLDVACGEGYGANLLSGVASTVVGVDIEPGVIAHASNRYGNKVTFSVGSCTNLPLPDSSIDVVVSFETLEHIADHEKMLSEVKRVLRPDGTLILSTPDKLNYTIIPKYQNLYHVKELFKAEFQSLLDRFFAHIYLFEQKICYGSVLAPTAGMPITGVRHYTGDFQRLNCTDGIMAAPYNIAVASDAALQMRHDVSLFQGWDIPTDLQRRLSDSEAAQAAATAEIDVLRKRLKSFGHRTVDRITRLIRPRRRRINVPHTG